MRPKSCPCRETRVGCSSSKRPPDKSGLEGPECDTCCLGRLDLNAYPLMRTINSNPARICVNGACVDPGEGVSCGATEGCVLGMCVDSWAISIFRARRSIERARDCSITSRSKANAAFVLSPAGRAYTAAVMWDSVHLRFPARCLPECDASDCPFGYECARALEEGDVPCIADPCRGVRCPPGQRCISGRCFPCLGCFRDSDCGRFGRCNRGCCE